MPTAPRTIRLHHTKTKRVERREHSGKRGYDERWKRFRKAWLIAQFQQGNIHCGECGKVLDGASKDIHVDHIRSHRGDYDLMYDESNLQALHAACHSAKTVREDGGFGRVR